MRDIAAPTEDPCRNDGGVLVLDGHRGQTLQLSAPSAARAIPRWSSIIFALAPALLLACPVILPTSVRTGYCTVVQ